MVYEQSIFKHLRSALNYHLCCSFQCLEPVVAESWLYFPTLMVVRPAILYMSSSNMSRTQSSRCWPKKGVGYLHKGHGIGQAKTLRPGYWHQHLSELAFKRAQSLLHNKERSYSDQQLGS